jgi:hypothetical protein
MHAHSTAIKVKTQLLQKKYYFLLMLAIFESLKANAQERFKKQKKNFFCKRVLELNFATTKGVYENQVVKIGVP